MSNEFAIAMKKARSDRRKVLLCIGCVGVIYFLGIVVLVKYFMGAD